MNRLCFLLVLWQIAHSQSEVVSSVERFNGNLLVRLVRSANNAEVQTNLQYTSNCPAAYKNLTSSHSMCLVDECTVVPLSQAEINEAVAVHNAYRRNVNPKATNMQKMVWDEELAQIATKWALQGRTGHDAGDSRKTLSLKDTYIGQNAAAGQASLKDAIDAWHSEVVDFGYSTGSINGKVVGHYTQVVQHMSSRVGCGKASCDNSQYPAYYVCNYAIGQGSTTHPYKSGSSSCADCPDSCNNGLCDCNGKLCYNGGTLDINTCTCSCPSLYSGDQCQTLQCTGTEESWCTASYTKADCSKYSNLPIDCNMVCGVCPYPCDGKQCANGGTLDSNTCQCSCTGPYSGETCEDVQCTGTEKSWCTSSSYTQADCSKYSNFPTDCNMMCGVCPYPCDGKQCANGGTLDSNTCQCSCRGPYSGATCEDLDCKGEESWCSQFQYTHCAMYSNLKYDCNILCQVCPA